MRYIRYCCALAVILATGWAYASDMTNETKLAFQNYKHPWKAALEKNGLVDYSVSNPYRYAIPLTTIGSENSKLMVTYASSMPGGTGERGILLFAKIPIE